MHSKSRQIKRRGARNRALHTATTTSNCKVNQKKNGHFAKEQPPTKCANNHRLSHLLRSQHAHLSKQVSYPKVESRPKQKEARFHSRWMDCPRATKLIRIIKRTPRSKKKTNKQPLVNNKRKANRQERSKAKNSTQLRSSRLRLRAACSQETQTKSIKTLTLWPRTCVASKDSTCLQFAMAMALTATKYHRRSNNNFLSSSRTT